MNSTTSTQSPTIRLRAAHAAVRLTTPTGDIKTGELVKVWQTSEGCVIVARGPRRVTEPMNWAVARLQTRRGELA